MRRCSLVPEIFPLNSHSQEFKESRGFELRLLFDMDRSPSRVSWVVRYLDFMARRGDPVSACPSMYKEPLDLFK